MRSELISRMLQYGPFWILKSLPSFQSSSARSAVAYTLPYAGVSITWCAILAPLKKGFLVRCCAIRHRNPDSIAWNQVDTIAFVIIAIVYAKPPCARLKYNSDFHVNVPSTRCIKITKPTGNKARSMVRIKVKSIVLYLIHKAKESHSVKVRIKGCNDGIVSPHIIASVTCQSSSAFYAHFIFSVCLMQL